MSQEPNDLEFPSGDKPLARMTIAEIAQQLRTERRSRLTQCHVADLLESQAAEIARLRETLQRIATIIF